jgi:hypothetical protein
MYTLKNGYKIKKFDIYVNLDDSNDKWTVLRDTITFKDTHGFISFNKIYSEDYKLWDSLE